MTGLDNLLREIQNAAQDEADRILRSAESETAKIEEENRVRIQARAGEVLAKAEVAAKSVSEREISSRQIQRRNEILALKQDLIRGAAAKAKQRLIDLSDSEYFGLLKGWATKAEVSGETVICLNARDLAREKGDFLEGFPKGAAIELSEKPEDISGGFLAVCGGVTVNCSIDSVFEIHADEVRRELQRILFD